MVHFGLRYTGFVEATGYLVHGIIMKNDENESDSYN